MRKIHNFKFLLLIIIIAFIVVLKSKAIGNFFAINFSYVYKLEIPKTKNNDIIIEHTGFSLLYNEKHEQANWVAYELTKEECFGTFKRSNKFVCDPKVVTYTANNDDYKGTNYDRGHLAPSADMTWSSNSMKESFYYSNISPQEPGFNRGIWKRLEEKVRNWAIENKSLFIVTGPVLSDNLLSIGSNKVSVPKYFYKVILDNTEPSVKGIAFIMPNSSSSLSLEYYAVSIDSVEKLTNIDFFPLLEDNIEKKIEKNLCVKCWNWN